MFLTIFIISSILIGIALLGIGVQIFFSKKKSFPETHVGHNKNMRKNKIYCIKTQQEIADKNYRPNNEAGSCCSTEC
jgi:hypothetical protein